MDRTTSVSAPTARDAVAEPSPHVRRWAWAVLLTHIVFTASWLLAAAWQGPRYNVFSQTISDMYADGAPGAWFLIIVFTLSGLALVVFARASLWPRLRQGGTPAKAAVLLLALSIFGLGDLLSPFEREGCPIAARGCTSDLQTATFGGALDTVLSTLGVVALIAAGFCLASATKRVPGWSDYTRATRRATIAMIVLFVLDGATQSIGLSGMFERLIALAGAVAIITLARIVLRTTAPRGAEESNGSSGLRS
ncbi:DUF998 domain-containing protein [Streptacidiphilus sp. N1-12]|uniref:DUF998 domain-containing protein n=2 Tax=Streptacidiphilus alkalitolerans TaxID=3342712 RepID=A0ABV6WQ71_9ACTN